MSRKPSAEAAAAWTRLIRVQQHLLAAVERDLKQAGFPPLAWYDALIELSRAKLGVLRPLELEKTMQLPQYSMSRLIDRMVEAGLVERKTCPVDGRGQFIVISAAGRVLQKRMGDCYAAAIERHVGAKVSNKEAAGLVDLLDKLAPEPHRPQ